MNAPALTHDRLHRILGYDAESGRLTWLVSTAARIRPGDDAGSINAKGRKQIKIDGRVYIATRLIWFWMTGAWPALEVDHRDTNPLNNRWGNLRLATKSQNQGNRRVRKDNAAGLKGVRFNKRAKSRPWQALIWRDGRAKYLGAFETAAEAHGAYAREAVEVFGEFARAA